jgi:hypothetical protein
MNLTADAYWESAKLAYAIGKQIGKKVILMSTSTGGTLALKLAANEKPFGIYNIKLMKCGGIYGALGISNIANNYITARVAGAIYRSSAL